MRGAEAPEELIVYKYREKFGLSWEEFLREPFSVVLSTMQIMQIEGELQEEEARKIQKKSKMQSARMR